MRIPFLRNTLRTQLVLTFAAFSLATALAIGWPAILLLDRQSNLYSRSLLDRAHQTTLALLASEETQVRNLALLIAERLTLENPARDLEVSENLGPYLESLREGAGVDALILCASGGRTLTNAGTPLDFCDLDSPSGFVRSEGTVWLLVGVPLEAGEPGQYQVMAAQDASNLWPELAPQTGLAHVILSQGTVVADSGFVDLSAFSLGSGETPRVLSLDGRRYLVQVARLDPDGDLEIMSLLDIEDDLQQGQQLRAAVLVAVALIGLAGFAIGAILSRRISLPLSRLAASASALRYGDFRAPVGVHSRLAEINQLAETLEDARVSLGHSLEQLRKEKAWIDSLLNSIVEGILTLDEDQRVTFVSEGVERIVRLPPPMVVGRAINEVFPTLPNEASFSAQIPGEGQVRRISVLLGHRESLLTVTSSSFLLPEAGNARLALLVRDVSNEERIHQLLGDFLANITHEFRTPLSALAASVELLTDQLSPSSTAEVEELLASLRYGIVNLQALIDNLLEAASIEAGRFRVSPHPSKLNSMLAEAVTIVRPLMVRHELRIEYPQGEASGLVLADRRRTVQALVNLLSNAIKHSPQGGVIRLHDVSVGKHIMVEVVDQGAGIPAEIRQQIFTRISSSPNLTGPRAGAGLGLSVVKAIVEAQHGEVGFDDQGAGGTKFWFTLPMADPGEGQR